ncbi:MAG: HpcH/HpaI aldolase/citrate lyase family protein [Bacteroidales bacterium]|nr:HpcH/HpaI aldolase/citrate lyase family protein [Bacteroidales bacterium]
MVKTVIVGNKGEGVRSDCAVTMEITDQGGHNIRLNSKVSTLFGEEIIQQAKSILHHFEIEHANVTIDDTGALGFVLAARLEAAIKKLIDTDKQYLPEIIPANTNETKRERFRFARLYLPGNTPRLMINAGLHSPDGVILDLEDAVAIDRKHEARYVVRNALRVVDFKGAERMVRINQIPKGLEDLDYVVPHHVNLVLVPKAESADQIIQVNERITRIQTESGSKHKIWLMPIIESTLGVEKAYEIATAADNIVAMAIGLEDYTADLFTRRTIEGEESDFARKRLVVACRAAKIQPIDSVFSDVSDMEGLRQTVRKSKSLGFDGMGCIHPRQIKVIKESFAPDEAEIEKAKKIVNAFHEATEKGLGVVSLGTKMIDPPVVKRAQKTINLAITLGIISKNWRDEYEQQ